VTSTIYSSKAEVASQELCLSLHAHHESAMEWPEKAYDLHAGYLANVSVDSSFEGFRTDPRFQAILKKIGFPDVN